MPIVAIVQDVRRSQTDRNAFQELDHFGIFRGCAKWVRRVERAFAHRGLCRHGVHGRRERAPGSGGADVPAGSAAGSRSTPAHAGERRAVAWHVSARSLRRRSGARRRSRAASRAGEAARSSSPAAACISPARTTRSRSFRKPPQLPVATTVMGKGAVDEHASALASASIGYFMGTRGVARTCGR